MGDKGVKDEPRPFHEPRDNVSNVCVERAQGMPAIRVSAMTKG